MAHGFGFICGEESTVQKVVDGKDPPVRSPPAFVMTRKFMHRAGDCSVLLVSSARAVETFAVILVRTSCG